MISMVLLFFFQVYLQFFWIVDNRIRRHLPPIIHINNMNNIFQLSESYVENKHLPLCMYYLLQFSLLPCQLRGTKWFSSSKLHSETLSFYHWRNPAVKHSSIIYLPFIYLSLRRTVTGYHTSFLSLNDHTDHNMSLCKDCILKKWNF